MRERERERKRKGDRERPTCEYFVIRKLLIPHHGWEQPSAPLKCLCVTVWRFSCFGSRLRLRLLLLSCFDIDVHMISSLNRFFSTFNSNSNNNKQSICVCRRRLLFSRMVNFPLLTTVDEYSIGIRLCGRILFLKYILYAPDETCRMGNRFVIATDRLKDGETAKRKIVTSVRIASESIDECAIWLRNWSTPYARPFDCGWPFSSNFDNFHFHLSRVYAIDFRSSFFSFVFFSTSSVAK